MTPVKLNYTTKKEGTLLHMKFYKYHRAHINDAHWSAENNRTDF